VETATTPACRRSTSGSCTSSFGELEVLKGIDFHVDHGEVVCVIGPSGSGKSTLLRCINRLEESNSGQILIEGEDITDPSTRRRHPAQPDRHGLPVVQPLPAPVGRAQPHDRAAARPAPQKGAAKESRAEPRTGRADRQDRCLSRAPLRRTAAAGGDRPGAVDGPGHDAVRRAHLRPRPGARRRGARRHARPRQGRHDDDGRHPRDELRARGRRPHRVHGRGRRGRGGTTRAVARRPAARAHPRFLKVL
jgi:energy-coupling factor transporter ATP-binding protein EcfA2